MYSSCITWDLHTRVHYIRIESKVHTWLHLRNASICFCCSALLDLHFIRADAGCCVHPEQKHKWPWISYVVENVETRCKKSADKVATPMQLQCIERRDECLLLSWTVIGAFDFFSHFCLSCICSYILLDYMISNLNKRFIYRRDKSTTVVLTIYMMKNTLLYKKLLWYSSYKYLEHFIRKSSDQFWIFICQRYINEISLKEILNF